MGVIRGTTSGLSHPHGKLLAICTAKPNRCDAVSGVPVLPYLDILRWGSGSGMYSRQKTLRPLTCRALSEKACSALLVSITAFDRIHILVYHICGKMQGVKKKFWLLQQKKLQ